jgi:hypothetical protein
MPRGKIDPYIFRAAIPFMVRTTRISRGYFHCASTPALNNLPLRNPFKKIWAHFQRFALETGLSGASAPALRAVAAPHPSNPLRLANRRFFPQNQALI